MDEKQLTIAVFVLFVCIGFLLGSSIGGSDAFEAVRIVS